MKRINIILLATVVGATSVSAQTKTKKPAAVPVKKVVPASVSTNSNAGLKNLKDSASYAIGQNLAQSITKDLKNLNKEAFLEAIKTVFNNQTPKFSEDEIRTVLTQFSQIEQESQAKVVIDEGRAFLAKNKVRPEVKTTSSGLQYEVLKAGDGLKPGTNDTVVCNYIGKLIDSTEFDNSYERGEPISIALNSVIKGWTEGLQLMPAGSKYRLYVPYELGYGLRGAGSIPGGAALIFDIELLEVKKSQ